MNHTIDVAEVAALAHIHLSASEITTLETELNALWHSLATLQAVDTTGVLPTTHGHNVPAALRADQVVPMLAREAFWGNVPATTETEFKLPKIVEDA